LQHFLSFFLSFFYRNSLGQNSLGNNTLVLTKAWVAHPSHTEKSIGVFMFKRLVTHICTAPRESRLIDRQEQPFAGKKGPTIADVHK